MPEQAMFESDEILWFNAPKWGEAGYAIPNPAGKTFTNNALIFQLHASVGRNMFELTHRDDVKFTVPPHVQWLFDLHQLITSGRKFLADNARADNDTRGLVTDHVKPTPREFLVYPVPYFAERIRQPHIRQYLEITLYMLSEMMQHSENEHGNVVTTRFAGKMGQYLQEILAQMSMRFFNKTRDQAYAPDFALVEDDFRAYDPSKVMTSVEMTEERPPLQWWPTENDLSQIRGISIANALTFAERWPAPTFNSRADGHVTSRPQPSGGAAAQNEVSGAFIAPAGQAPGA